jgi:hypothetical protein
MRSDQAVMNVALDTNFAIPGDAGFPLNQAFEAPRDRNEAETLRQYLTQVRQELAQRLLLRVYGDGNVPSKVMKWAFQCSAGCTTMPKSLLTSHVVVVKFYETEIYGQGFVTMVIRLDYQQISHDLFDAILSTVFYHVFNPPN